MRTLSELGLLPLNWYAAKQKPGDNRNLMHVLEGRGSIASDSVGANRN